MKTLIISFSQNKKTTESNSVKVAHSVQKLIENHSDVSILEIANYDITPCILCGECALKSNCIEAPSFMNVYDKMKESDLIFFIVPFYSPFPSKLMITLEKMNQLIYAKSLSSKTKSNGFKQKQVGLIVHGGMEDGEMVRNYYKQMISSPLKQIIKGLGFAILEDDNYFESGLVFGLERDVSIIHNEGAFPTVVLKENYIHKKVKPYIDYITSGLWN